RWLSLSKSLGPAPAPARKPKIPNVPENAPPPVMFCVTSDTKLFRTVTLLPPDSEMPWLPNVPVLLLLTVVILLPSSVAEGAAVFTKMPPGWLVEDDEKFWTFV